MFDLNKVLRGLCALLFGLPLLLAACGDSPTAATSVPLTAAAPIATTAATPTIMAANTTTAATQFPFTFTDATGASITLEKKPERIVCNTTLCLDMLFQLGLEPVGVRQSQLDAGLFLLTSPEYFGTKLAKYAKIKGSPEANVEEVASLKPDLVIDHLGNIREALKTIAPLYVPKYKNIGEVVETLRLVGRITGREAQAEAAIKKFEDKLAFYSAKSPKSKKVLYFQSYNLAYVPTDVSALGVLIGQISPFPLKLGTADGVGWSPVSLEKILEIDPDVIFIGVHGSNVSKTIQDSIVKSKAELTANPFWKELKAVKSNQVYEVSYYPWQGVGLISLGIVLDDLATRLYPEVFPKALP
jgi:iron complex transport system substrate-binding protein